MTTVGRMAIEAVRLSDVDFWALPNEDRDAAFATLRAERPIAHFEDPELPPELAMFERGSGYYAITRHADVVEMSRHPQLFCSGRGATSIVDMPEMFLEFFGSMINMDNPRHARLRRIVSTAFNPNMVKDVEESIARVASDIISRVAGDGGCDFVIDLASRLPLKVICDMMGVPESDYDGVFNASNVLLSMGDTEYIPEGSDPMAALLGAATSLTNLMKDLAEERRINPTDDLTTSLIQANVDGESLTAEELSSFFILLVVAGNETTRNAISHGLLALTEHPDQRAIWASDVEGNMATAVDEIVRWASPVIFMRRTVTAPTVVGGHAFVEGDKVLLFYNSANRDESVFADPFTFDIRRGLNPHVGFGAAGPHFCLGAHLARREISVMFRELFDRLPDIEASGEPDRLRSNFINGIKHLPCTFTSART